LGETTSFCRGGAKREKDNLKDNWESKERRNPRKGGFFM